MKCHVLQAACLAAIVSVSAEAQAAWTEKVLNSFDEYTIGGFEPFSGVIADSAGNLYGTTYFGNYGYGGVFELSPPGPGQSAWKITPLYYFSNNSDGGYPVGNLVFDAAGNLYGTTRYGGQDFVGVVFELSPPAAGQTGWTLTTLHSFATDGVDGNSPFGALVFDHAGNLYGTGSEGGKYNGGVVFELSPPAAGQTGWTETILHAFKGGTDGAEPEAGVIFDGAGRLYGTTYEGGTGDNGTAFRLTPPAAGQTAWTETVIHRFDGATGASPEAGLVLDAAGNLYGTNSAGGAFNHGTVFKLVAQPTGNSGWAQTVLHNFNGTNGSTPYAGVIFDTAGNLYGEAGAGGASNDGVVFKLAAPAAGSTTWTSSILRTLTGPNGSSPGGGLIFDAAGNLYGASQYGGAYNFGAVFKLSP